MLDMRRREFITLLGGAAAWPLAARAQLREQKRRVGVLVNLAADDPIGQARVAAFVQGLQAAGWSDGGNVRIDTRWAAAGPGNYRKYAADLIALGPDVVLASSTAAVVQLQQASRTVPIVFVSAIDPVGLEAVQACIDKKDVTHSDHYKRYVLVLHSGGLPISRPCEAVFGRG